MEATRLEQRLDAIDRRLGTLIDHVEETRRHQREIRELKDDVSRIATDVFESATTELEEVAPHFETDDLVHLAKRLLRNTRNLSRMLDRLESASDFLEDAAPLQKAAFLKMMANLDDLDRKGYFAFLAEVRAIADQVVTSFSPEDVRLLGENIVAILGTVRSLTQPEILKTVNNVLSIYRNIDPQVEDDVSFLKLLREARSPEVRRGLVMGLRFLKNVSSPESPAVPGDSGSLQKT